MSVILKAIPLRELTKIIRIRDKIMGEDAVQKALQTVYAEYGVIEEPGAEIKSIIIATKYVKNADPIPSKWTGVFYKDGRCGVVGNGIKAHLPAVPDMVMRLGTGFSR